MVIAIAYDIKIFLLILFVALVGFAQGFWLLSVRCDACVVVLYCYKGTPLSSCTCGADSCFQRCIPAPSLF
jgi:hypothetical protein